MSIPVVDNWTSSQWESYAIGFWRDTGDPLQGAKSHHYSWKRWFGTVAGRASFFEDAVRKIAIVTFRGAVNPENWINCTKSANANLSSITVNSIQQVTVHEGFAREYAALQAEMVDVMRQLENRSEEGWYTLVTGNSMGGALATICVADLHLNKRVVIDRGKVVLVTFGSPRTGNKEFADMINDANLYKNIRVEIKGDCFAALPKQHNGDFWHRGKLTLLSENLSLENREESPIENDDEDKSWSYIPQGFARVVEDFFKAAGNLPLGIIGVPKAFNAHVNYHMPYKDSEITQLALKVARGQI